MNGLEQGRGLRRASDGLTTAAGGLVPLGLDGPSGREVERMLAQSIRVASCVALAVSAESVLECDRRLSEARGAAAALVARLHLAVMRRQVAEEDAQPVRRAVRALVDEIDLDRYRRKRRAG